MSDQLNIHDYLSDDELKEMAIAKANFLFDAYINEKHFNSERIEMLASNSAYALVFKKVEEIMNEDISNLIAEQTVKIIKKMSSFNVFGSDYSSGNKTKGQQLLEQTVVDSKPLIEEKVREMISGITERDLEQKLLETVSEIVSDGLFSTRKTKEELAA